MIESFGDVFGWYMLAALVCPSFLAIPVLIALRLFGLRARDQQRYVLGIVLHGLNMALFAVVAFFFLRWAEGCVACTHGLILLPYVALAGLVFWSACILAAVQNALSFTRASLAQ